MFDLGKDRQHPGQRLIRAHRPDFVGDAQHAPRLIHQRPPARRKSGGTLAPVGKGNPQLLLQRLDLQADCGMAEPHRAARGGETALLGDGDQGLKLTEVHIVIFSNIDRE